MAEIEEGSTAARIAVLNALRTSGGRATVGDIVTATGLERDVAETTVKRLLDTHKGHLEVGEGGDLVYRFDPKLVKRDDRSTWEKFKAGAASFGKKAFKVWIMLMLVVYFIVYVVMIIAAIAALQANNRDSNYSSRRGGGGIPIHWLFYMFYSSDYNARHYTGHNHRGREVKPPFYLRVFSFVFGPDQLRLTEEARRKQYIQFIQSRRGVVTVADIVEMTGLNASEADEELGRLLGALGGDVEVSDEGELLYSFPELMLSASGRVSAKPPLLAWQRLEPQRSLTGNKKSWNGTIIGFNAFNLLMSVAIAPAVLMPILGISGAAATVGLVAIPALFSILFFAIPLVRKARLAKENAERHDRNVRKLTLRKAIPAAIEDKSVTAKQILADARLPGDDAPPVTAEEVDGALTLLASEFMGDVESAPGQLIYTYDGIRSANLEATRARKQLALDHQEIGEIVFDTGDDELNERMEMREFDERLGYETELVEEEELEAVAA